MLQDGTKQINEWALRTTNTLESNDPDLEHLKTEISSIQDLVRLEKEWKKKNLAGAMADFEAKTQPEAWEGRINIYQKYFELPFIPNLSFPDLQVA